MISPAYSVDVPRRICVVCTIFVRIPNTTRNSNKTLRGVFKSPTSTHTTCNNGIVVVFVHVHKTHMPQPTYVCNMQCTVLSVAFHWHFPSKCIFCCCGDILFSPSGSPSSTWETNHQSTLRLKRSPRSVVPQKNLLYFFVNIVLTPWLPPPRLAPPLCFLALTHASSILSFDRCCCCFFFCVCVKIYYRERPLSFFLYISQEQW